MGKRSELDIVVTDALHMYIDGLSADDSIRTALRVNNITSEVQSDFITEAVGEKIMSTSYADLQLELQGQI